MNTSINLAGVTLKNPVMTASGTFGSGAEYSEFVDLNKLGAVVTKGVANIPWPGNPTPRIAEVSSGMLNAIGLQNPGIDVFMNRDIPFLQQYDTKIIVNVCGKTTEDYCEVVEKLAEMTLEEKVAQMFMVTPEALTGYSQVTEAGDVTYQALSQYPVGGIIYFSSNIADPEQLKTMTQNTQDYAMDISGIPIFLGIDEEGGMVARIASNDAVDVEQFPNMWAIGEKGDLEYAYHVGDTIGEYLWDNGLNVDFAPDADVLTNSENKVIGQRAFSDDALLTAQMSVQVMQGLEAQNVYACMKHFPGHGGTMGDTHQGYAYTERTIEQLREEELVPFQYGIDSGISFIMVSHIALPNVTGDETPASMSKYIVTDLLREEMGYDGIVITDAMNMGAITTCYNSSEGAVEAVLAGVDIVLMPKDFKVAYQGVIDAVETGVIEEERIDESVKRILRVKLEIMKENR